MSESPDTAPDQPRHAGRQVLRGDGAVGVGDQRDDGGAGTDVRDAADESVAVDDRRVHRGCPSASPAAMRDLLREGTGRERGHARGDRAVVLRKRRPLLVRELLLQRRVLRRGGLVLQRLRAPRAHLAAQLLVLRLRRRQPVEVPVDVAERPRDALGGDLERTQRRGSRTLDVMERAGRRRAERDGQQRERHDDEDDEHEPPDQRATPPWGATRLGALDRRAQHRHARGAVRGCHRARLPRKPERPSDSRPVQAFR